MAAERVLTLEDLREAEAIFLGNSVRGLRRMTRLEDATGRSLSASLDASSV
jgi:branched-subunit amino acid aminotransferase/4-amino-4-deoxychorismate lyase